MTLEEAFPYTYMGGGYFRKKGFPKGKPAPTLHAMDAIRILYTTLTNQGDERTSPDSGVRDEGVLGSH